ncbi:MAG: DNA starvation/stationary phase protection protein [Chlamydiia bacterium]|nr:DNA starvation/stationary phase protection protein [Chlamydiia bacterium]
MSVGIEKKVSMRIVTGLSKTLANTYLLQVKTQNFHWNVNDARFSSLHAFFEGQYEELQEAVDEIAERIRMLGHRSPGSMREFMDLGTIDESTDSLSGDEMLSELLIDHDSVIQSLREEISESQKLGDEGTADLLIGRLRAHEKMAWMIRSHFIDS